MAGPLIASELTHVVCPIAHDTCRQIPRLTDCCCKNASNDGNSTAPLPTKVQVAPSNAPIALVPEFAALVVVPASAIHVQTSPPRLADLDLRTLFAALLI